MYNERRVGGGSKLEMGRVGDRKRLNEALDKHLERSSPSTSTTTVRDANGKDHRFALSKSKDQLRNSAPPPDNKCSDVESETVRRQILVVLMGKTLHGSHGTAVYVGMSSSAKLMMTTSKMTLTYCEPMLLDSSKISTGAATFFRVRAT